MAVIDKNTKAEDIHENDRILVKATGLGNFEGSNLSGSYIIRKEIKDLSKSKVDKIPDQTYDGTEKIPANLTVRFGSNPVENLEEGTDYDVIWCINNVNKGTATILLRGKGAYSGTKTAILKIVAAKTDQIYKDCWNGSSFR